jgi:dihydroorotate dehydrogenase
VTRPGARTPYRLLFDHVLTRVDPETAHHLGFTALRAASPAMRLLPRAGSPSGDRRRTGGIAAMGLTFPGPLGVAAGFDKNALGIDALAALGFSFVEVGTVTGEAQPGNPRPRLFRLPADRAVVNRMGFNNDGAEVVASRLAARRRRLGGRPGPVVGVNIGKTKVVLEEQAVADYEKSTALLAPYADYLVVNVSSPNTPGLRDLQAVEKLAPLLQAVRRRADAATDRRVPLLVKIAPDLSDADVVAVGRMAGELGLDGIVATNTTVSRDGLVSGRDEAERVGAGGLSGAPLRRRSREVLGLLRATVGPELTLVSVGGIDDAGEAAARLDAGATLLQAYTAFVYQGAAWPRRVQEALAGRTAGSPG